MRQRSWTDDDLRNAVVQSLSFAQVLQNLGLAIAGGSYVHIQSHINRLDLDTSHFCGKAKNGRYGKSADKTLADILSIESPYVSSEIRRYLIRDGLKTNQCEKCGLTSWRNMPLTCELHHINGIRNDHRLENLQILCPNCHSQIPRIKK